MSDLLVRCNFDPRFSYALVTPAPAPGAAPPGLLVTVHNSVRWFQLGLKGFTRFGQRHGVVVLAPFFPVDLFGGNDGDGYKFLLDQGLRYDMVLNAVVDEVAQATGCGASRILLHGYSGGAQFAHRYLLLHPQRVRAAAIGAPGSVTLLDGEVDWWGGVRDVAERFGTGVNLPALRRVPIQLVVGDGDTEVLPLREQPPSRFWPSESERLGANRIDRLRAFQRSLAAADVASDFELMPGLAHGDGDGPSIALAEGFFAEVMAGKG